MISCNFHHFLKGFFGILFFGFLGCATTGNNPPIYKVKITSGDSLAGIASRYGTSWDAIARLNHIKDYHNVKVGDELLVSPGLGGTVALGSRPTRTFLGELSKEDLDLFLSRPKTADQNEEASANLDEDLDEHDDMLQATEDTESSDGMKNQLLMWPVLGSVSSNFGQRGKRYHYGIDIRANRGTPIKAAAPGKVIFSGRKKKYGNVVIIEHKKSGAQTLYAHCSRLLVKNNQEVELGEVVGQVGATGNAKGVHLHFEYRLANGKVANPINYLPKTHELELISFAAHESLETDLN